MEFIPLQAPRLGIKVYFEAAEGGRPKSGVYTVVENDEYTMAGYVVIESADGHRYGASAEQMEILERDPDFLAMEIPQGFDGLTFLPSEKKLRDFGFTDRREGYWYFSRLVGSAESFDITIPKAPVGEIRGEPVYGYAELVMDEFIGQPSYFGTTLDVFRFDLAEKVSKTLSDLLKLGLIIDVSPIEYNWKNWPEGRPLRGLPSDQQTLSFLRKEIAESQEAAAATAEPVAAVSTAEEPAFEATIDLEILAQVAAAIDIEAEEFRWNSMAHGLSLGEYIAPTVLKIYTEALAKRKSD